MADLQVAAFRNNQDEKMSATYLTNTGLGVGMSFVSSKNRFYWGFFSSTHNLNLAQGETSFDTLNSPKERSSFINESGQDYSLVRSNVGFSYVAGKKSKACISLVVRDVGNSKFVAKGETTVTDPTTFQQNTVLGFSVSPRIGRYSTLNLILEQRNLENRDLAVSEKFAMGAELNFFDFGSSAFFSLRAGQNHAGASFGASINLGLVQFEYAREMRDYGEGNLLATEAVTTLVASTNITDM